MKTFNKIFFTALMILVSGIFSCQDPNAPTSEYTVTVDGQVVRLNRTGLDSVVITLDVPFRRDTVRSDGTFSYSFTSTEKNDVSATLSFRHINLSYYDTLRSIQYSSSKKTISLGEVAMRGASTAQDSIITGKASARAGVIAFVKSSSSTISIRGAGANDATNLTFEVRDSLGTPVDIKNKVSVSFSLIVAPDILTELNRTSAFTNTLGQVIVQLSSGEKAGIAQVRASALVKNAIDTTKMDTIKSQVVSVVISGGLPVESKFTIGTQQINIPGLVKAGMHNAITAIVGDSFSNPVQKGTIVYFSTTGGIIQPTSTTDENGTISVDLITGNPAPLNGVAKITAQVGTPGGSSVVAPKGNFDDAVIVKGLKLRTKSSSNSKKGNLIRTTLETVSPVFSKTISVVFSGAPRITSNDSVFVVPGLGAKQIQFTVDDINGNPMSQGTSIQVTGVGLDTTGAVLSGDLIKVVPDTDDKSYTKYSISVADKRTKNLAANVPILLNIEVSGPNGNIKQTFRGVLASAGADSGKVGSISMVSTAVDTVVVNGAGSPASSTVQVKVLDVNNIPSANIPVTFGLTKTVGGGEYLSSTVGVTDINGIASVIFNSGIRSGLVQVQASVKKNETSINSDTKSIYVKTGAIASLSLVSSSSNSLSVKGGGGNENAILIFEAKDSLGNTIDGSNQANITLTLQGDTAGARINPSTVKTDPNTGRVTTNISSGVRSGIILITAQSTNIKSTPVQLSISGGQPVASRFSLSTQKVNLPAGVQLNISNTITAVLGDTFGNPVQSGTVVYFSTNGGIIQPAATTSGSGLVSASLVTANPFPPAGVATVTASVGSSGLSSRVINKGVDESIILKPLRSKNTSGKAGGSLEQVSSTTLISKSLNIVFSGTPRITSNDSVFVVPGLGTKQIQFTVDDINGNPMSQGTSVRVNGVGLDTTGATLTGNVENTIPDTDDKSYTKFYISVADRRTKNLAASVPILLNVEVSGPNGNIKKTFSGILASAASDSGKVGGISMVSTAVDTVVVNGAGLPASSTVQVKVLDVNNIPSANIPVTFSLTKTVGGGEYLSSSIGVTNGSGIATVTFNSGIRSGLVQVQASVKKNETSINSDTKSIYVKTGAIASLNLVSSSSTSLSVKGGGGNESSILIFEAKDSLGNTIDGTNQANINLTMEGDTAGARINPSTVKTDPNTGRITTFVTAGIQAGIIQVTAKSGSISSPAIQLSVSGGLPTQSQFTLSLAKKNYSTITDKSTTVSITAGDVYGNPAKSGTLINFKTNGGLIDASATTGGSGSATSNLQIINPQPPAGLATIEAKTFGAGGVIVRDTQTVIFSRDAIITEIGGPYANFDIEDGLSKTFQYSVADINSNPLAQGNTITVKASGTGSDNIDLSGDINVTTSDTKIQGVGTTQFSFTARDKVKDEGQGPKPLTFEITVSGPNTSGTLLHAMSGTLKGGSGTGNEGNVASVSYVKSTKDTIFVANAGTPTTDTITFKAMNLKQQPVKNAAVQFFFTELLNASEYLSPSYAVSDDSGEVKVVVHSGIKAGVLKVEGRVTAGTSVISSTSVPVYIKTGPLATISLISLSKNELSITGVGGEDNAVIVFEGRDVLGNSVDYANQTNIFFQIIGGSGSGETIKPDSAITNPITGRVSATLTSGKKSTVLQVVARNSTGTIKSTPVSLTIFGGYADNSKFYLSSPSGKNFAVIPVGGTVFSDNISIDFVGKLGDKYGNPVKTGTAVYFSTTFGIIGASSFTDNAGNVSSTLVIPTKKPSSLGIQTISARTVGENGDSVSQSIDILLTGVPVITNLNVPTDTVTVADGRDTTVNFSIVDANSNPISAGHNVSVSMVGDVTNELVTTGDINVVTDANKTNFSFRIRDLLALTGKSGTFTVTIKVNGITGVTEKTFYGRLLAPVNNGGLPAQSQFTMSIPKKNYSTLTDRSTIISVIAGDALGNPAKAGTVVTFKTNGGLIDGSASTNLTGFASSNLQIVNPAPPSGIASIVASTIGAGGVVVKDSQTVVFSRDAIISEVGGPYSNFEIEDGLSKTFQYSVADINGNPIAQGNTITVSTFGTGSSNIVLSGDISVTMPDTKLTGTGSTLFTFTARDIVKDEGQGPKPLGFKITVSGPNTSVPLNYSINGTLKGGSGVGNEGSVASVSYVRSSKDTIFVANIIGITTDTITYKVKNLNQLPVKGAAVQFFFTQALNASEFLSPSFAVTDDSGEVKVAVHSGVKAGVLGIQAKVTAGSSTISSNSVSVYIKTGPLASIALISVDKNQISVRGVGGEENTTIVYEARDALGNPLDFANQTRLDFRIKGVVGFDEEVNPVSALTNPFTGRVSVNVNSGIRSTVLQVIAQNSDSTIKSSPVPIVVHGGFVDSSLFIFKTIPQNISIYGGVQTIGMQLGDKYGNPVKPNTAVYFETNAGIISAASFTDASGLVSAQFTSVANLSYLGDKTITASTAGELGLIKKSYNILMSGAPIVTVNNVPTDTVTLFDGASSVINYVIADTLGNPVSNGFGYNITVEGSVGGEILLTGDINGTLPDTQDKINGTKFSFNVSDRLPNAGSGGTFKIKITVTGVSRTSIKTIYGKLLAPSNIVISPTARVAASIALIGSPSNITIAGGGGAENTTMTFEVRDSVGAPITLDNRAIVNFTTNFYPNTYVPGGTAPVILPSLDSTDETGKARVSVLSGTQAGVVQIEAVINLTNPVRTIKSQPVKIQVFAGFVDQKHFTIATSARNFPGLDRAFITRDITVQVADKYSNPALNGTAIYFNSAHGTMTTGSATSQNGFVTNTLYSANPLPQGVDTLTPDAEILGYGYGTSKGFSRVYARTLGRDGQWVMDSVLFLWTGAPTFTNTGSSTIAIADGGTQSFTFKIVDQFGHPMSAGTSISVTASAGKITGDVSRTIPDAFVGGAGITTFTVTLSDDDATVGKPGASNILVVVNHPVYGSYQFTLATGTVN